MSMDKSDFLEGYSLMNDYMTEKRIKTKQRKFRRKLDKLYKSNMNVDELTVEDEVEYLKLLKYFFNDIMEYPETNEQKGLLTVLNLIDV